MDELKNCNSDYSVVIAAFIAEIISAETSDKLQKLRFEAMGQLQSRLTYYRELGYAEDLLCAIARKKSAMIMNASSKTEIKKIMALPSPYFDGNRFIPDKYDVSEEEMIFWAETSLRTPLNEPGFKRYKELFGQIFPEQAKEIFGS